MNRNNLIKLSHQQIQLKIFIFRKQQIMLDHDLADLYEVQNKRLNEQVKRNIDRFQKKFRFQLNQQEKDDSHLHIPMQKKITEQNQTSA